MTLSVVHTDGAPAAIGPYSQAIDTGDQVFVSGQLGMDPASGQLVAADTAGQARQALANLKAVLAAAGCSLSNVVAADVFLVDMGDFVDFNTVYESVFGDHKPARAVVAVAALPKDARVEIKCVACKPAV